MEALHPLSRDSKEAEDAPPPPAPSVNTSNSVRVDGWSPACASGRETGMTPVYSHNGYALNKSLPWGPKAGHIYRAVRFGREKSQAEASERTQWHRERPQQRPAKSH